MSTPLLNVTQLSCLIEDAPLFQPIDFVLHTGMLLHLQGANGIGKTSLLRAMMGLSAHYQGRLEWQVPLRLSVGYLGHLAGFHGLLNPQENLRYFAAMHGRALTASEIEQILRHVQLWPYAEDALGQLSAGQKQRFKIAQLLSLQRSVWIMDEPFTSLDRSTCLWLEQQMCEHVQQGGAIVFTSHQTFAAVDLHYHALNLVAA
jgi:heme exporter protein A